MEAASISGPELRKFLLGWLQIFSPYRSYNFLSSDSNQFNEPTLGFYPFYLEKRGIAWTRDQSFLIFSSWPNLSQICSLIFIFQAVEAPAHLNPHLLAPSHFFPPRCHHPTFSICQEAIFPTIVTFMFSQLVMLSSLLLPLRLNPQ